MKFAKVPKMAVWERPTLDFLESCAMRIENKFGRLKPKVVSGEDNFTNRVGDVKKSILEGEHFT